VYKFKTKGEVTVFLCCLQNIRTLQFPITEKDVRELMELQLKFAGLLFFY